MVPTVLCSALQTPVLLLLTLLLAVKRADPRKEDGVRRAVVGAEVLAARLEARRALTPAVRLAAGAITEEAMVLCEKDQTAFIILRIVREIVLIKKIVNLEC